MTPRIGISRTRRPALRAAGKALRRDLDFAAIGELGFVESNAARRRCPSPREA